MAHKVSLAKDHFPAMEDCRNIIPVALKKSIGLHGVALEVGMKEMVEPIGEHK